MPPSGPPEPVLPPEPVTPPDLAPERVPAAPPEPATPPRSAPDPATIERPWTATYPPGVPADYRVPVVALPRFLDDAVRDFPYGAALVAEPGPLDHVGTRDRVAALAGLLRSAGLARGDRVLIGLPAGATLPVALFAAWRIAAVAVPVAPETSASTLRRVVEDAGAAVAIVSRHTSRALPAAADGGPDLIIVVDDDRWLFPAHRGLLKRVLGRVRRRGRGHGALAARADGAAVPAVPAVGSASYLSGTMHLSAAVDAFASAAGVLELPAAGDLAMLTYTRSRAAPDEVRGLRWTHAALVAAAFQARLWIPDIQAGAERILVVGAMTSPTTLVLGPLLASLAAATVICEDHREPVGLVRAIERHAPTLLVLPTRRLAELLSDTAAGRDLGSLRLVLVTGDVPAPALAAAVERRTGGARVRSCFVPDGAALTHAQPVYGRTVPDAMGLPVTGTCAAVVDPDRPGTIRPVGAAGRLLVYGPQLADGYWRREDESTRRFVAGWLRTDELATVDEHGVFRHLGTIGEVVERDGTWVSLRRVEAVLLRHPAVRRAGVVAGSRPGTLLAAVVCQRRGRPAVGELLVHCRAHLDSPAVPDDVILLEALPETEAGELARDALRELLAGR